MPDATSPKRSTLKRSLVLCALTVLTVVFGYLVYREVLFFIERWRWQHNVFIQWKIICRIFLLLLLTCSTAIGPVGFCLTRLGLVRRDGEKDQDDNPGGAG